MTLKKFSTAGQSIDVISFELDGVELQAYRPKKSLILEMAELAGVSEVVDGATTEEEAQKVGVSVAQTCLDLIPKVFTVESRLHLDTRIYDPADPFDILPDPSRPDVPTLFTILSWLMEELAGKEEASPSATKSPGGSRARVKASTVTARSKAAASTTGRSRTKG